MGWWNRLVLNHQWISLTEKSRLFRYFVGLGKCLWAYLLWQWSSLQKYWLLLGANLLWQYSSGIQPEHKCIKQLYKYIYQTILLSWANLLWQYKPCSEETRSPSIYSYKNYTKFTTLFRANLLWQNSTHNSICLLILSGLLIRLPSAFPISRSIQSLVPLVWEICSYSSFFLLSRLLLKSSVSRANLLWQYSVHFVGQFSFDNWSQKLTLVIVRGKSPLAFYLQLEIHIDLSAEVANRLEYYHQVTFTKADHDYGIFWWFWYWEF